MIMVLLISVFLCILVYFFMMYSFTFIISYNYLSFFNFNWLLNFDYDSVTFCILLMLIVCYSYVYYYNIHYFVGEYIGYQLGKIILLFVSVMCILVSTGDFLLTLIFWEYLGVVSFFLILFYDNYLSLRSSVVTLVSSRFGDVCLFLLIGLNCYLYSSVFPCIFMFFFIIFTKSASFPFISWLLEAMRAPTPVSSLVHSSTLVAAGVWFAMRYDYITFFEECFYLSCLLILTIIITGVSSLFFIDLKKIVALSTCNNISWCVLYLIYGDFTLSLFQLLSHGVSKCMLFMLIGDIMSGSSGSQASNCVYSSSLYGNWNILGSFMVILGLSGVPYIGVFFTKHFLLSSFINVINVSVNLLICLCMFLSYLYSFRLCKILVNTSCSSSFGMLYFFNSSFMVILWLFVNYYLFFLLDEVVLVSNYYNISLLLFQVFSIYLCIKIYDSIIISNWSSSLFGCDNLVELLYSSFYSLLNLLSLFLFRWDNFILYLFSGLGISSLIKFFNSYLLNIIIISFFLIFCLLVI
uniref:NADH:ubiquinone reductase (H(+)-translocating) n=1 Tax=Taenia twitchelli TaxID=529880 RepID=N0DLE4_9CEST|nr:NADH dehydrogenase subunit 5 [Taenia twitchelli]BAN15641.1 NADH dehydrogenase subunit 5 [Taenia twitchelli]